MVRHWGTVHAALAQGQSQARITLREVARPGFWGVGALAELAGEVTVAQYGAFVSDNGNLILDCWFKRIPNPGELDAELKQIPGVVETGLFVDFVDQLIVGFFDKTTETVLNPIQWPKDS